MSGHDAFRYTKEVEAAYERLPALKSVEPLSLRLLLCGFILGQEHRISELERKLSEYGAMR